MQSDDLLGMAYSITASCKNSLSVKKIKERKGKKRKEQKKVNLLTQPMPPGNRFTGIEAERTEKPQAIQGTWKNLLFLG